MYIYIIMFVYNVYKYMITVCVYTLMSVNQHVLLNNYLRGSLRESIDDMTLTQLGATPCAANFSHIALYGGFHKWLYPQNG